MDIKTVMLVFLLPGINAVGDQDPTLRSRDSKDFAEILSRQEVHKELELIEDQIRAIADSNKAYRSIMRKHRDEIADLMPNERAKRLREVEMEAIDEQTRIREAALIPPQLERLEQLRRQMQTLGYPVETIDRVVDLTDEQKKQMVTIMKENTEELVDFMWHVHRRSQADMKEVLTRTQRKKWERTVGPEFKFKHRSGLSPISTLRY